MTEIELTWDLRPLVPATEPDQIQVQLNQLVVEAEQITADYKGKISSFDAAKLLEFLKRLEKHMLDREGPLKFANLKYAANSLDPEAKQIYDLARRAIMKIQQALAFAEIEVAQLVARNPALIENSHLAEYKHYLERLRRRAPHFLSDTEERLIIQKDRFGIDSWFQLQQDWLSTRTFEIEIAGEKKVLPYGEIIALYEHPNRHLRKEANRVVYDSLGQDEILWASALRALIGDHLEITKQRQQPSSRTQSLIDNDVDAETIDALLTTVETNVELYRRYLRLKARLMNLPKLGNYDIVAPLPNMPDRKYIWAQAQQIVIDAYAAFSTQFRDIVIDMFTKRRIDGEVRKGKQSGAFCTDWFSGKSAFIMQSYNSRLGDVFTLAHENGHAIHAVLLSQKQSIINTDVGMCVAEAGSIFGELLLADKLITEAKTSAEKLEVLAKLLDEFGMTVFQVSARYFFEMWLYEAFERGEYLDGETIAKYWTMARDKIYGDAIDWLNEMRWEWTMKVHYYLPRFRLYNYPYVFGNLFVFGLYRSYKEEGSAFIPKLVKLLSAGSTQSPRVLATELGFDITSPTFWALGMKQAESFIKELESIIN